MRPARKTTECESYRVAYWEEGHGPPLLLIHGTGPGGSALGYWNDLLEPLARDFHVIACDLIGFGQSDRKTVRPFFDSELWVRQAAHMTALFGRAGVNVVGHSASASVALRLAATTGVQVGKVVTTGALGASGMKVNAATVRGWTVPTTDEELKASLAVLFHDPSLVLEAHARRRGALSETGYGAYYGAMFEGDKQPYLDQLTVPAPVLSRIACDVMLVHGRNDQPAPFEHSLRLAAGLPQSDVVLLGRCGHAVAAERPKFLVDLLRSFCL